jgi:phosphoglycerate kinase
VLLLKLVSIVRKKRGVAFAEQLASLGDIYVNDALNCSQSACSTTIIAQFLKNVSITIGKEIESLNKVLKNSENR